MHKDHYFEAVYDVVRCIPRGRVTTYGAIADFLALGSARMVGWALRQSMATDASLPAHRVVNRNGELTGRAHFNPPESMAAALRREGVPVENDCIPSFRDYFWHPLELAHEA